MRRARIGRQRWLPTRRLARRSRGFVLGGVWLRFVTWSRASALDRELAGGADPMQSDELSLRVGQLRSAKRRARLACALRGAVELADRPLMMPPAPIRRREIQANRELLLELAERLGSHAQKEQDSLVPLVDEILDEETDAMLAMEYASG